MNARPSSLISGTDLQALAEGLLASAGLDKSAADLVAESLVWADMRGASGHGVSRIPQYIAWLTSGEMNGQAIPRSRRRYRRSSGDDRHRPVGRPCRRDGLDDRVHGRAGGGCPATARCGCQGWIMPA